jgi:hypothetical protein
MMLTNWASQRSLNVMLSLKLIGPPGPPPGRSRLTKLTQGRGPLVSDSAVRIRPRTQ